MKDHSRLGYGVLTMVFGSLLVSPSVFAGVACYSRDSFSSNFIRAVQQELKTQQFYRGSVDGRWGSKTESALDHFKSAKVPESRALGIDSATLHALFGSNADSASYGLSPNPGLPPEIFATYCR
jgi:peptidoglycan hydrolase-like protein with peptidoglycan-binding domain